MNRALLYLAWSLLKRRSFQLCRGLLRPTTAIGFGAVAALLGFMFYYRHLEAFGQLVRPASLLGGVLLMLGGALFKGFLHESPMNRAEAECLETTIPRGGPGVQSPAGAR